MESTQTFWKLCSSCKKPIGFGALYQVCSVSTCNHSRRGLQFCSVSCWSAHVPILRHKDAWALEERAPTREQWLKDEAGAPEKVAASGPRPAVLVRPGGPSAPLEAASDADVLIVVSKLKTYIKARSDMSTAAEVIELLSDKVRALCDDAIQKARADGRKTVMNRDF